MHFLAFNNFKQNNFINLLLTTKFTYNNNNNNNSIVKSS